MGNKQTKELRNNLRFLDGLIGEHVGSEELGSSGTGAPIKEANWLPRAIIAQRQLNKLLALSFNRTASWQAGKIAGMGKLNAGKMSGIKNLGFVKASAIKLTSAKESTLQAKAVANRLKATLTKKLKIKAMPKKSADITNAKGNDGATLWSQKLVEKLNNVQTNVSRAVSTVGGGRAGTFAGNIMWDTDRTYPPFVTVPDLSRLSKVDPFSPFKMVKGDAQPGLPVQFDAEKYINAQEMKIAARLSSGLDGSAGDDAISLAQANNMMKELTDLLSLRIRTTPIYDAGQDGPTGPKRLVLIKLIEFYAATLAETENLLNTMMADAGYPDGLKA